MSDEAVLAFLGGNPLQVDSLAPPLHPTIADIWGKIIKSGLPKETKEELVKKNPPAENCTILRAPIINPEVKSAMSSTSMKKDSYQAIVQTQLSASLSAVGTCLTDLLKEQDPHFEANRKSRFITLLSEAGKCLSDLHHEKSLTRRHFIVPGLNPVIKSIANGGTLLFGEEFPEKLKTAKAVEKYGKDLARSTLPSTDAKNGYNLAPKQGLGGRYRQIGPQWSKFRKSWP